MQTHDADRPIRRIIVGVDGSEGATRAVGWAARLAKEAGAEVVAVHTMGTPVFADGFSFVAGTTYEDWQPAWKEWREDTQRTMETSWCRPLAEAGVAFRVAAIDGGPQALVEYAGLVHADLLVVGRRGRAGFAELVLGSFSHHLVHHAAQPVVVVPHVGS